MRSLPPASAVQQFKYGAMLPIASSSRRNVCAVGQDVPGGRRALDTRGVPIGVPIAAEAGAAMR
jgi:hypothetical protein